MAEGESTENFTSNGNFVEIPTSSGESCYPYNKVRKTLCGHQFEEDDSWGNERIKRQHCTGTFEEFTPEGGRVVTVVGDDYEVVIQDKQMIVKGGLNIVVLEGDCYITANNNMNIACHGDMKMSVAGNRTTRIGGNDYLEVTGDIGIRAGESEESTGVSGTGNIKMQCYNYDEKIRGEFLSTVNKKASVNWNWTGDLQDEDDPPPTDGTNIFWIGKNLFTNIGGKHTLNTAELDIRAAGVADDLDNQGINMSSGTGFTISAGLDEALTIENGNLDLILGDINLVVGSINTGFGSISAPSGGISGASVLGKSVSDTAGNVLSNKANAGE